MRKKYYAITGLSEEDKKEFDTQRGNKKAHEYLHELIYSRKAQNE